MFSSLEAQSRVHFGPEGNTMTGGLHQGFVGYLYEAQISQYAGYWTSDSYNCGTQPGDLGLNRLYNTC